MANIMILGSGGFGIALSVMLHKYGHTVTVWSKFEEEIAEIRRYGEHRKLLPGVLIDPAIRLTTQIEEAQNADLVLMAVPSQAVRAVAKEASPYIPDGCIVGNVGKGFDPATDERLSDVIANEIPHGRIVALSGPSHAEEIARGVPTTIVAASRHRESAEAVQDLLMNTNLRIYVSDDILGVELGGALKNIIAVCAGICDGLGLGDNTKAALMTRGLAEIARLGIRMGAQPETFIGLSGMGDLIVTCTSMHSRNRRAGILIGQGIPVNEATSRIGMTVEGIAAAIAAHELSIRYQVEMPITEQLYQIITQNRSAKEAVSELMGRPKRHENEQIWMKE